MTADPSGTDFARLSEDDELLDRVGRGESVADASDPIALLVQWRAALPDRPGSAPVSNGPDLRPNDSTTWPGTASNGYSSDVLPPFQPHTGTLEPPPRPGTSSWRAVAFDGAAVSLGTVHSAAPTAAGAAATRPRVQRTVANGSKPVARPHTKPRRAGRVVWWVAAAAAVIAAGVGVAGLTGVRPDAPSAPTRPAGPNQVAIAAAEQALGDARAAIEARDLRTASALLDRADALIADVRDPIEERRLRAEMDRLRALTVAPTSAPDSATSPKAAPRPAQVLPTTTAAPVTAGAPTKPSQVSATTPSVRSRPGLPTLLPSVIPTFR